MKTLAITVAIAALMGSSAVFAEEAAVPAEQVAQANEVSVFEDVETVALSSEEMKIEAGRFRAPELL